MGKVFRVVWQRGFTIALLLVSLGISGCGQLSLPSGQSSAPLGNRILEFVPRHALLTTVVSTAVQLDNTWQRSDIVATISQFTDSLLTPLAINFNQDIRPWLGNDIAFAITAKDVDRDRRNGRQTGYLLVLETTDGERLREFLELFWQRQTVAGSQPAFTQVNGVPIISGPVGQEERQLATAVVAGSTLLVANDVRVLYQSLQVAQAPTLQLSGRDCCAAAWVNLHIPEFVDWLGLATSANQQLMSIGQWQQLDATAVFRPQGITMDTWLTSLGTSMPKSMESGTTMGKDELGQYLPASMAWAVTGHNLSPVWAELWGQLSRYQRLPSLLQQGQQWLSTQLAQSLSEPLGQLLANDYAVGQLEDGTWVMAVVATPPTAITQLDEIAQQQGLTVSQLTLNGQSVIAWSHLKTRVDTQNRETTVATDLVALHTKVAGHSIFSTSIDGLMAALAAPDSNLFATQRFQRTVRLMETSNQGYLYGTWAEVERLLASNRWFSLVKPILQPLSQSIDAIAITTHDQVTNQSTGTVSILLKK